ncbi:hypothetical protein EV644_113182 [Kribbella orskensis]|uniref:Uncharacterized protein n=1 Tax=Kribbella orskensis TaxID=2512216 RepID=A0ABY2BEL4_9ACTN|nr:hypothetical protein EV642_114181 [Kribbella sp. VKM Ac-2500]TCO17952.1 hypothetical protein EV644_113182 [Kribbella orskensis]
MSTGKSLKTIASPRYTQFEELSKQHDWIKMIYLRRI